MATRQYEESKQAIQSRLEELLTHNIQPPVTDIRQLKFIDFWDTRTISTFEPLLEFPHIEHLHFRECKTVKDLSGIEQLPNLRGIHIGPKVIIKKGFGRIFEVDTLEELTISSHFEQLVNLQPSVRVLTLCDDRLDSLPQIPKGAAVEELRVGSSKHCLTNLASLAHFPTVKILHVSNSKTLTSLSGVENCKGLEVLWANFTSISDLTPLHGSDKLVELRIRKTDVCSLAPLYPSTSLRFLYTEKTRIRSIEGIVDNLPNLELLWIFDTKVKDLSPLANMKKLQELVLLRLKGIKNWDFLRSLQMLRTLDLHRTSFCDIDLLLSLPSLKYVLLSQCDITKGKAKLKQLGRLLKTRKGGYSLNDHGAWMREIDDRYT